MAPWRAIVVVCASLAAATLLGLSACGTERVPAAEIGQATPADAVICDGVDARATVRALFARIDTGRAIDLATYFVAAPQFVGWYDPDAGEVTAVPEAENSDDTKSGDDAAIGGAWDASVRVAPTLDAVQARLDYLADRISITLVTFHDDGFRPRVSGDLFTFTARVQPAPVAAIGPGRGHGVVDCNTGLIKAFSIDRW
jgi:hypothetical protein